MAIIREYRAQLEENGLMMMEEAGKYRCLDKRLNSSWKAAEFLGNACGLKTAAEETFVAICLDSRLNVIGIFKSCTGSADKCCVDVRGVCAKALLMNASRVLVAHNHPAGALEPSSEDEESTKLLKAGLETVGITMMDHIIIPAHSDEYFSFKEENLL